MSGPPVTFVLFTYNQERFVREAVRAALAQTYSPLEILISDDASQDKTFDIVQDEVYDYDGPHRVVLNRNERNLGIGGHINRVMEITGGRLIVAAAGDDISLPERTEKLVRAWLRGGVFSVYSNYAIVDEKGVDTGEIEGDIASEATRSWQDRVGSGVLRGVGCAHAWDRTLFDVFGPLPESLVQEDIAIPFRAALLGEVSYIDERLAKYRRHDVNVWKRRNDLLKMDLTRFSAHEATVARIMKTNWESLQHDTKVLSSLRSETGEDFSWALKKISARIEFYAFKEIALSGRKHKLWNSLHIARRVKKLGPKSMAKVALLGLSPMAYCRVHQQWYGHRVPGG